MAHPALDLSQAFATAVEAVAAHLVRVEDRASRGATGIVWSEDLVISVHHPLSDAEGFALLIPNGSRVDAELVGRDPATDLALLRAKGAKLSPARFADAAGARPGELLVAVSRSPRGLAASLRLLAVVGGEWQTRGGGRIDRLLQTDTAPMPGFAGGALIRADGSVLGLSTGALARGGSVAISESTLRRVIGELTEHGRVRRGYLGVSTIPVRLPQKLADELGQAGALLVTGVQPGGPAEAAGVLLGDAIVTIGDRATTDVRALRASLSDDRIGQELSARIVRAGKALDVAIVIGAMP
jgi:S1-C subfamily serine protease